MKKAFTIPEVLAVVAIIVIIMAILMPTLVKMRVPAYQAMCATNNRNLVAATMTYSADNRQWLPFTNWGSQQVATGPWKDAGWLYKYPNISPGDQEHGQLWPYLREPGIYRCPQDVPPYKPGTTHQITSYLLNGAFSGFGNNNPDVIYKSYKFGGSAIMFWEVDDTAAAGYYNDGSSYPDEAVTKRHLTGLTVGSRDGHTEWLTYAEYWAIEAQEPGRLWCKPGSTNGH